MLLGDSSECHVSMYFGENWNLEVHFEREEEKKMRVLWYAESA